MPFGWRKNIRALPVRRDGDLDVSDDKKSPPWFKAPVLIYAGIAATFYLIAIVLVIYLLRHTPHWLQ